MISIKNVLWIDLTKFGYTKMDLTSMKMKMSCCGSTKQQQPKQQQQRQQNNKNSFNLSKKIIYEKSKIGIFTGWSSAKFCYSFNRELTER